MHQDLPTLSGSLKIKYGESAPFRLPGLQITHRRSRFMPQVLTLEIPDELDRSLRRAAAQEGVSVEQWVTRRLRMAAPTDQDRSAALERLLKHAGTIDMGRPTGSDTWSIDADLAREAGGSHEGAP